MKWKKNNQGTVDIMIISILFITFLCSILALSLLVNNAQMKNYEIEDALDVSALGSLCIDKEKYKEREAERVLWISDDTDATKQGTKAYALDEFIRELKVNLNLNHSMVPSDDPILSRDIPVEVVEYTIYQVVENSQIIDDVKCYQYRYRGGWNASVTYEKNQTVTTPNGISVLSGNGLERQKIVVYAKLRMAVKNQMDTSDIETGKETTVSIDLSEEEEE